MFALTIMIIGVILFGALLVAYPSNEERDEMDKNVGRVQTGPVAPRIRDEKLLQQYTSVMTESQFERYINLIYDNTKGGFTLAELKNFEKKLADRNKADDELYKCAELNNLGSAAEKDGDVDSAIGYYEENIKGDYAATHSFQRLMVLYRKLNRQEDEIRVINRALLVYKKAGKANLTGVWQKRLEKILNKKDNNPPTT